MPAATSTNRVILVLDDVGTPSVNNIVTYTSFLSSDDRVSVIVITSKGALSDGDKTSCLDYVELSSTTTNGLMEIHAQRFHEKYHIDLVYTKQEDLILRAAHIRRLLGVQVGLKPEEALLYRDKAAMKEAVRKSGFNVPDFQRIHSPCDIIAFVKKNGFPVIIKPTLGSASAGVRVVKSQEDLLHYLEKEFYDRIDDKGKCMDYSGDMIIESFCAGKMYHINGYAQNGNLVYVWPFAYLQTNLEFTMGKAYGNVLIPKADAKHQKLINATNQVLKALPCPQDLLFHLELFETKDQCTGEEKYVLCEIAARRPGGSIAFLINAAEGGAVSQNDSANRQMFFPEMEFRCNNGLPLRHDRKTVANIAKSDNYSVADIMIPRQIGELTSIPEPNSELPVPNALYYPFAKVGSVYTGFDINTMNTAARIVVTNTDGGSTVDGMEERLLAAHDWFRTSTHYKPAGDASSAVISDRAPLAHTLAVVQ
ncbi:ATP-grasp domain-containing protein [Phlyctochytrium arcticum]|nr:ATP-grasp domain-containing protein [Phlyctochytrium arcticum]